MNYIVLDLEWNQSPDGKAGEVPGFPFEIFEIGAVKLNEKREYVDRFSCYIKPGVYKELHHIIKELTHVSMQTLNKEGVCFNHAISSFFEWCQKDGDYIFCTWGTTDMLELQRNMRHFEYKSPMAFPLYFYDVQKLFSMACEDGKIRRSLENVAQMLDINMQRDFHSAINDALYTAEVMKSFDFDMVKQYFSIDTYYIPADKSKEIKVNYGTYYKYVSRGFESKEDAMADREVQSTRCYICNKNARKKIRWFATNTKVHYCLSECKAHGLLKGRLRVREDEFGNFYAIKIIKQTNEDGALGIKQKQLEIRKKRRERRAKEKMNKG